MVWLRDAVYIFENPKAQRVKVGVTCNVAERLRHFNDLWLGRKVTCQICAGRYVKIGRVVPPHRVSGRGCPGGGKLPIEEDV